MDRLRLASFHCLLILSCGDVERNPGPPPELAPRSEVLRRFTRCIQSELVKHIYQANNHNLPTHLYERDPPGWNKFDKNTAFENICNIQKGGSQTFDKLVKLFKKDVRPIPTDILDVIVCYEKLRDSKRNSDETKKWKVALENYVSQNKSMKNKQAVIDNLDDNLLIEVLKKAAEKAKQGNIGSTDDGVNNVIVAIEQVLDAILEHNTNQTVEKSKLSGKKRQATETVTKIQQVKRKKCFSSCQYKGTGVKGKKKSKGIAKKGAIAIVTQELDIQAQQQSEPFMNIDSSGDQINMDNNLPTFNPQIPPPDPELLCLGASCEQTESPQIEPQTEPDSSGNHFNMDSNLQIPLLYSKPSSRQTHTEPQLLEPQQMEPYQFEPGQFETQWMEPQENDPQLPISPPSPYCDGIIESEDIDLQGGSTRNIPMVQDTSDMYRTLPIQEDTTDCLSESLEDEALKSMPLQDIIRKYPY